MTIIDVASKKKDGDMAEEDNILVEDQYYKKMSKTVFQMLRN